MTRCVVYQVDAFTRERFRGNPAGVVRGGDGLREEEMQAIARELNNPETAFLLSPTEDDHEVRVRFFTPTMEVPSCGHATVAAHYVRAREEGLGPGVVMQRIGIGVLPVEIVGGGEDLEIVMTQGAVEFGDPLPDALRDEVLAALGVGAEDRDPRCPIQVVSTGHSKVLIGVADPGVLDALEPDLGALTALSRRVGSNGYFVFTLRPETDGVLSEARMFAPAIGIPEDPVTGNGNGPLGAYLVHHRLAEPIDGRLSFTGLQGRAMGRPGRVRVTVDVDEESGAPVRVRIGGHAVIVFRAELEV